MSDGDDLKVDWHVLGSYISSLLLSALPDRSRTISSIGGRVRGDSIWIEM